MPKRNIKTVPIDKDLFLDILYYEGTSIGKLGANSEVPCSASTIRRQINNNKLRMDILEAISKILNIPVAVFYNDNLYSVAFTNRSPEWTNVPEYNLMFLRAQQEYANDLLHVHGYVFLSDVYKILGLPLTKTSIVCGWSKRANPDSFVDFGLLENEIPTSSFILLKFNTDGVIYDFI